MTTIDLIPPDAVARRETTRRVHVWTKRAGAISAVAVVLYIVLVHMADSGNAELLQLSVRYSALQERLRFAESLIQERDRLSEHRKVISAIRRDRTAGGLLEALGVTLTPESRLSHLTIDMCGSPDSNRWGLGGGDDCNAAIMIRGTAPEHQQVGRILRNLVASSAFDQAGLVSAKEPELSDGVQFEIVCSLADGPADE